MKNNPKKVSAFSLIELSIVILIVGILISGIFQGSVLYSNFKLATAQSLTTSSPVSGIKDLVSWYETSLNASFDPDQNYDGNKISNWRDINQQRFPKNATQSSASSCSACPTFLKDSINGLPALRFDGNNDYFNFDTSDLVASDYAIFVVEQRRKGSGWNYFIGTSSGSSALLLGYWNTGYHISQDGSASSYSIPTYSNPFFRIHTFYFSQITGKKYYMNGGSTPYGTSPSNKTLITAAYPAAIGRFGAGGSYYSGDISEIIIFSRALTDEERGSVEGYLGQKYAISIKP